MSRIAHVAKGVPYRVGNSISGIRRWISQGYRRGDNDILLTRADPNCPYTGGHVNGKCRGHGVVTHWRRPMLRDAFRDPHGKLRIRKPVDRMTLDQVLRLRSPDGYRIVRVEKVLRMRPVRRGRYIPVFEPKADPRFEQTWFWEHLADVAQDAGSTYQVRAIKHLGGDGAGWRRVRAARRGARRAGIEIQAWTI